MNKLDLASAQTIVTEAIAYGRKAGFEPLTVVVLDDRATVKAVGSDDGSSTPASRSRAARPPDASPSASARANCRSDRRHSWPRSVSCPA